jgi:hypothetical protein
MNMQQLTWSLICFFVFWCAGNKIGLASNPWTLALFVGLWIVSGVLGWGLLNYAAYKNNPEADSNPKKLEFLHLAPIMGPFLPFIAFLICLIDGEWYIGLRFK